MTDKPQDNPGFKRGLAAAVFGALLSMSSAGIAQGMGGEERNPFMMPPAPEEDRAEERERIESQESLREAQRLSSQIEQNKDRLAMIGQINKTTVYFHEPTECRLYEKDGAFADSVCLPIVAKWLRNSSD